MKANFRKMLCMILSLFLLIGLCACGSGTNNNDVLLC